MTKPTPATTSATGDLLAPGGAVAVMAPGGSRTSAVKAPAGVRVRVILPVYNESRLIGHTLDAVLAFVDQNPGFGFLFVDDGSSDDTAKIIRERLAGRKDDRVALLSYAPNRGKGRAVHAGVERCLEVFSIAGLDEKGPGAGSDGGLVCFTDGDLAYPLDHLTELAAALEKHDVVIGSRSLVHKDEKNTSIPRRIMGGTFNILARALIGVPHKDTQAGLKGFRARAAREIFRRQSLDGFAFDVEIVFLARRLGFSVGEIPARVSEEHSYKVSKVDLLRDPLRMFRALLDVRTAAARGRYD